MKKLIVLLLVLCMLLSLAACGGKASDSEDCEKIVVAFRTNSTVPSAEEIAQVSEEISKLTREEIGVNVELVVLSSGSYNEQIPMMVFGGDQIDVVGVHQAFTSSFIASDALIELSDLLEEYGQGILEVLPENRLLGGKFGENQYCVPILCDIGNGFGYYVMRQDILDKYGINVEDIKTHEDLTEVFRIVHENEPDMTILAPRNAGNSFLEYCFTWDQLGDNFGVLDNGGDNFDVVNLFETDSYREYLDRIRSWYNAGYISPDVVTSASSGIEQMAEGNLFCYIHNNKPGAVEQEEVSTGKDLTAVQLLPTLANTFSIWQWGITSTCEAPEKAMQVLNLMYTNADVLNLMAYGIEGEDYVVEDDGRIGYPEGKDSSSVGYTCNGIVWSFGNEFNAHVWNNNSADIWEQTLEWNSNATYSKAYGFRFDSTDVQNEMAAVGNVYKEYAMSLECGLVDPDDVLSEMNDRLYAAGLQTIIDAKQAQLDEWVAINGLG